MVHAHISSNANESKPQINAFKIWSTEGVTSQNEVQMKVEPFIPHKILLKMSQVIGVLILFYVLSVKMTGRTCVFHVACVYGHTSIYLGSAHPSVEHCCNFRTWEREIYPSYTIYTKTNLYNVKNICIYYYKYCNY